MNSSKVFLIVVYFLFATHFCNAEQTKDRFGVAINFSGALATTEGNYGGTFLMGVSLPVERESNVRLGFDSGVFFTKSTWLPILLSVVYHMGTPGRSVHPYMGGAVGPMIRLSSGSGGLTDPLAADSVRIAMLIRAGIRIALTQNLDLMGEMPLGGLTGLFYIAPTLGMCLKF